MTRVAIVDDHPVNKLGAENRAPAVAVAKERRLI